MKPIRHLSLFTIVVAMSQPLAAQSTWNGTTNANWSTATNWSPGIPVDPSNITIADTTTNNTLNLDNGSHSVGSITIGTAGTRTSAFTLSSTNANTLTINTGVTANGNFTAGIGARLRGNLVIAADQLWQVAGEAGSARNDRGIAINEIASPTTGTLTLNAKLTKTGTGQLTMGAVTVSGASDIVVSDGSLKLNAGGSLPLTLGGTGKIVVNNSGSLLFSKNTGTFATTSSERPIQFNHTSKLETGSGRADQTGTYEIASNMEWNGVHTITNSQNAVDPPTTPANVNYNFSGVMSGAGSVTKNGASQLAFLGTSANTFSGQLTVSAGTLRLDKTGVLATAGNVLVTGGALNIVQSNQIGSTSTVTVNGSGTVSSSTGRTQTLAAFNIGSTNINPAPSVSGFNITGTTSITSGTAELNSGQTFTTNGLLISNNATLRMVGNHTTGFSTINVGAGGLTLTGSKLQFGSNGNTGTLLLNLGGDLVSTGTSLFTVGSTTGPRVIDLQAGSRSFAVNDGTLDIRTTVQNGTLTKSGAGTLILSRTGSTADFSFTGGPVQVTTQATAGNVSLSGGTIQMDVGGATPAKITTSGNFTSTGGSIDLTAVNGPITPGSLELVRYNGTLTGTPVVNIPPALLSSRMNPVVDYGTGTNSAITVTATALPLSLIWHGATSGGLWDYNNTANFNIGTEKFYSLDTVTFDDTGFSNFVQLDSALFPAAVTFNHGTTVPTYLVQGTGSISGTGKLTKTGTGTTVLATDNSYTGGTDVLGGTLQVGNAGTSGNLGTGTVLVDTGTTLTFARDGSASFGNVFTGAGSITNSGPGTAALTANSAAFTGTVTVGAGTLQFGDGGADGSLGTANIDVFPGATFGIKRSGAPTIANAISGAGAVTVSGGGSVIMSGVNSYTGGVTVTDAAHLRAPSDAAFGAVPLSPTANAIRLNMGGLKNQDSDTIIDTNRGITITTEGYFTAGWSKSLYVSGPITGTGDIYINYDSGRVVFANTTSDWNGILTLGASKAGFTGTTNGILEINTFNNGATPGPLGVSSADPTNLVFNGGRINYTGSDANTDRGFTLQTSGTIDVSFANLAVAGTITGPGSLTKTGAGILTLTGTNDFLGEKIINNGTLVLSSTAALGSTASFVRFNSLAATPATLDLATDTSVAPYPVTIAVNNSGTILSNVATPGNPGINHTLGNFDVSRITVNVAAGANVIGGDPRITIPSLSASSGDSGTTTLNPTTANLTLGSVTIASGNAAKTLSLGGTSQDNLATGTISDGLNILTLRKDNTSLWTVSGDNTFTGNVAVDKGVMLITHTNALGSTGKTLYVNGNNNKPELRLSGGISPTVSAINLSGAGVADASGAVRNISGNNTLTATTEINMTTGNGGTTLYSDSGTLTIATPLFKANATGRVLFLAGPGDGVINGVIANGTTVALPITKSGAGTWTLNGAHTYSGATTVNAGTLSLGQAALNDAAAVTIGATAVLNLNFTGIDRVGSLTINGVAKGNGVYNATTDPGFITGTGSIRVGPEGYSSWTSNYPFTVGVNDGPNDDPDADGISNLLEYVLGGVPVGAGAGNTSILPAQNLTATDLVLTFKRSDLSEIDVTLKVQWSEDMTTWNNFATIGPVDALPAVDVTEDSPTAELDTVVVTIPRSTASGGKLFARVQAVK